MKRRERHVVLVNEIPSTLIFTAVFVAMAAMSRQKKFTVEQLRTFVAKEARDRPRFLSLFVAWTGKDGVSTDVLGQLMDELVVGQLLRRTEGTFELTVPGLGHFDGKTRAAGVIPRHRKLVAGLASRFEDKLATEAPQQSLF